MTNMPSSSLLMRAGPLVLSLIASATALTQRTQQYQLLESWQGESFINNWNFYGGSDPTKGYVTYANQSFAQSSGLVKVTGSGSLYMGVDYQTTLSPSGPGRDSVRIETQNYYSEGLFVVDLEHMPGSVCGTWPAFWSVGPNWPNDGEIDIIEGVNLNEANEIVLHSSDTCDISSSNEMDGTLTSAVCGESSGTTGCVVEGKSGSFGTPFNQQGGGVYALEWTDTFIKIWFFPRDSIPTSITSGSPDTSSFGTPMANMQGSCDFSQRFANQKLIFDTTFCGEWAGGVFGTSGCPMSDSSSAIQSCVNYVAANPAVFKESYWEINSVKVYQLSSSASSSVVHSPSSTSSIETLASSVTSSVDTLASSVTSSDTTLASEPTVAGFSTTLGIKSSEKTTCITPQPTTSATSAAESTVPVQIPVASLSSDDDQSEEESDATSTSTRTSTSTSTLYVTSRTTICPLTETGTDQLASTPTRATSVGGPPAAASSVLALGDSAVQNTATVGSALPIIQTYSSSAKLFASSRFVSSVTGAASSGSGAAITTAPPSTATNGAPNSASSTIPAGATFTAGASKLSAGVSGLAGVLILAMLG